MKVLRIIAIQHQPKRMPLAIKHQRNLTWTYFLHPCLLVNYLIGWLVPGTPLSMSCIVRIWSHLMVISLYPHGIIKAAFATPYVYPPFCIPSALSLNNLCNFLLVLIKYYSEFSGGVIWISVNVILNVSEIWHALNLFDSSLLTACIVWKWLTFYILI